MANKKKTQKKSPEKEGKKNAEEVISEIQSKFGEGSIMKLGEAKKVDVASISSGSPSLDIALGIGGVPRGRVIEIYGPESSGKTTLALHIAANAQNDGGSVAFVDAEHALDPAYAKRLGVNTDELLVSQPDAGEQALDIVETLVRSNSVDVIVVDSVAALTPKAEIEGEMGDKHVGLQARLMSQALRKLTSIVSKTNVAVIFINQIRMKIGVMFGNPETTTGGNALKFYSSVRIEVRRAAQIKQGEQIIGNRVKAKVVKNKVAPPFQTSEFDVMYNKGISKEGDVLDLGEKFGVVSKTGSWYNYQDEKIGQGREAAKKYLQENPESYNKILKEVKEKAKEENDW
ncbi:MAG: recombinase RecA [Candidatus Moranbacteria bacterium]|nr:recombinase RecA [Candidatus Moranbacteria bacterium]